MKLEINHRTTYRYDQPVALAQHRLHMLARPTPLQTVLRTRLMIEPAPTVRADAVDVFGNAVTSVEIERPHEELVIEAASSVDVAPPTAIPTSAGPRWDEIDAAIRELDHKEAQAVRQARCMSALTRAPAGLVEYVVTSFPDGRPLVEAALDLTRRITQEFRFDVTATDVSTPLGTVLKSRRGVCQDFAHLTIAGLRALRIPARYVSGYILTIPPPGRPKLMGADASHAWVSVWCGTGLGWIDFDPTNGRLAGEDYATVAWGRDYADVSPITGILLGGGSHVVTVGVDVKAVP